MLRYRADIRTLCFVAIYFALVAVQWVTAPSALWIAIPLVAVTCVFSFLGAVATHNTVHCPVFKQRWANRAFQVVLTLTYGHPVSAFVPGHNLSHHKHTQTRRDVMRTTKVRYRSNLLNGLLFMPTVGKDVFFADMRYFKAMYRQNPPWFRQMILEATVFLGTMGVLLVLDWKKFLLYVLLPHQYAAWGIITINYLQHDGCDQNSEYNHSRNFLGKFVNFLAYNNGYHTIHHMEPGLHWSLLPAEHAKRVAPFIHPELDQPSMLVYLFRTFVWPAKRRMYDGKPVEIPAEGPDEEWIPPPREVRHDLGAIAM
ncbi:fatty acid desaturase family protein [Polyangium jinanense]|uniref:Fatty acid desaturase n=1 Tax=Polyangium jinanense TaxID=2829994 RepID=A0A9X4AX52_9BACT|nr:fatty acid desaturase [Polyangium jinanense]MDC3958441.1 fatty acid desaturase [Polyangium jinanense]MDC3987994.1 fatty acid desaturase [Polyangium jinanense]